MKQKIKTCAAAMVFSFFFLGAFAQDEVVTTTAPRWVSDKGYWVVEGNDHLPLNHTIWFYNNDNVLIYKETVAGIKLNVAKKRVKMKLKKALEVSVLAWEQNRFMEVNKNYVAAVLK